MEGGSAQESGSTSHLWLHPHTLFHCLQSQGEWVGFATTGNGKHKNWHSYWIRIRTWFWLCTYYLQAWKQISLPPFSVCLKGMGDWNGIPWLAGRGAALPAGLFWPPLCLLTVTFWGAVELCSLKASICWPSCAWWTHTDPLSVQTQLLPRQGCLSSHLIVRSLFSFLFFLRLVFWEDPDCSNGSCQKAALAASGRMGLVM